MEGPSGWVGRGRSAIHSPPGPQPVTSGLVVPVEVSFKAKFFPSSLNQTVYPLWLPPPRSDSQAPPLHRCPGTTQKVKVDLEQHRRLGEIFAARGRYLQAAEVLTADGGQHHCPDGRGARVDGGH